MRQNAHAAEGRRGDAVLDDCRRACREPRCRGGYHAPDGALRYRTIRCCAQGIRAARGTRPASRGLRTVRPHSADWIDPKARFLVGWTPCPAQPYLSGMGRTLGDLIAPRD